MVTAERQHEKDNIDWATVDFSTLSRVDQVDLFRRSREALSDDPYRPRYHFSPPGAGLHALQDSV